VATGRDALGDNISGLQNTANGYFALSGNTTGSGNIALGNNAGANLTTGNNNIDIGNMGVAAEADTIRIGTAQTSTFIAGIFSQPSGGLPVLVDGSGKLGTGVSSVRFKQNIQDMGESSHALMALRPVTFDYKPELGPNGTAQFGLVAEEVEKVDLALVVRDADGKPYTVRYEAVNAMLLNEFLKEHRMVTEQDRKLQQQEKTIAQLKKDFRTTVAELNARLEEQESRIQKVSAQLEVSKPAPQIVANDQ
jgi:hypothetical protein